MDPQAFGDLPDQRLAPRLAVGAQHGQLLGRQLPGQLGLQVRLVRVDLATQVGDQFGAFVSGVASLPRVVILTMHDISLKPKEGKGGVNRGALELSGTVKTYRYLDEKEVADQEAAAAAANGQAAPAPAAGGAP